MRETFEGELSGEGMSRQTVQWGSVWQETVRVRECPVRGKCLHPAAGLPVSWCGGDDLTP